MRAVFAIVMVLCGLVVPAASQDRPTRPNVIYILADDLGYGDLGCYGQKLIRTPRLDRMAAEGLRFTDHYAGAPLCAPSRCSLMTGKHLGHARIRANARVPLEPEDVTVAEVLREAGYRTGAVGKWGLGLQETTGAPWKQGFDEFFGYLDQADAHHYYPQWLWRNDRKVELPENREGRRGTYSHDLFAREALEFVRRNRDRPFFLYLPFTIPHAEVLVPEDSLAEYRGRWPEKPFPGAGRYAAQPEPRAARAAMITRMDRDVGRILDLLEELKLSERTLVIFTSDNGPITAGGQDPAFFNSAGPLRGLKFTLYEGGIRVPMIARWPGRVRPGTVTALPSAFDDVLPTFAELAGRKPPPGDGVSLLPALLGHPERQRAREYLYWEYRGGQAVRLGNWKGLRLRPDGPLALYDLAADPGETRDVAAAHPEVASRIERAMAAAHVESPLFPLRNPER